MGGHFLNKNKNKNMNELKYNNWIIKRDGFTITLYNTKLNKSYRIELIQCKNYFGKINISLSNICQMECLYCSEGDYNNSNHKMLNTVDVIAVINNYIDYIRGKSYIEGIQLSFDYGGEPFCCYDELLAISKYFKKRCFENNISSKIQVTTNGNWEHALLNAVIDLIDEFIVSIDGYKELHDRYRKYKDDNSKFERIIENAKELYKNNKLKQISTVVTTDTIKNAEKYIRYMKENFPGTNIKLNAVKNIGGARENHIAKIPFNLWRKFIAKAKKDFGKSALIVDSKPEKDVSYRYYYGCEYITADNWFLDVDGKITCCTDRGLDNFIIGRVNKGICSLDFNKIKTISEGNYVENISKCSNCIAKYYCAGGCPIFRDVKINCKRRIKKYAELLISNVKV